MTGAAARIAAQAKLNLHLRVLSREESGFHSIETVFHRIDLADDVLVETTDGKRTLDVEGGDTGPAESNLAFRAATAYASDAGWPRGFRIELVKRIPVGAGLGGGSADAAAVLRLLNFLSPQPITEPQLLAIAARIGSDVTFLASESVMAFAWGRGERMLSCAPLPQRDILLMTPAFSIATAEAYRWLDEDRESMDENGRAASQQPLRIDAEALATWKGVTSFARNDFEPAVTRRHPELSGYLDALKLSGASVTAMTGSGSTVFGVFDGSLSAENVAAEHRGRATATSTSVVVVQPVMVG